MHKSFFLYLLFAALCLCPSGLAGCSYTEASSPQQRYSTTFLGAMDTVVALTAYCTSSGQFDAAAQEVRAELERLDRIFNRYDDSSAISAVNAGAGGPAVSAPQELTELIEECRKRQSAAGGVNIAMGRLLGLWHDARESGAPPSAAALESAAMHGRIDDVVCTDGTIAINDPLLRLDTGAVAKGYVADRLANLLRDTGLDTFLLDCGTSSIVCAGAPPGKGGWSVALTNPDAALNLSGTADPPQWLGTLQLQDRCVGVSGDYQQYFLSGGIYYSHLIEEGTRQPARYFRSVCVLAPDAFSADYYSTALFCMPYEQAAQAAADADIAVLWIFADGTVKTAGGFPAGDAFAA